MWSQAYEDHPKDMSFCDNNNCNQCSYCVGTAEMAMVDALPSPAAASPAPVAQTELAVPSSVSTDVLDHEIMHNSLLRAMPPGGDQVGVVPLRPSAWALAAPLSYTLAGLLSSPAPSTCSPWACRRSSRCHGCRQESR